jgi:hypothetical protein
MLRGKNYDTVSIEGEPSRVKATGTVTWRGLQTEVVERTPRKNAIAEPTPNTALKLFVPFDPAQGRFVPSLLQAYPRS